MLVTFEVPRLAAETIRIDLAAGVAELLQLADARLRYEYAGDVCAIACSTEMAACLCESFAIRVRDPRSAESEAVVACAKAVTATLAAMDPARVGYI